MMVTGCPHAAGIPPCLHKHDHCLLCAGIFCGNWNIWALLRGKRLFQHRVEPRGSCLEPARAEGRMPALGTGNGHQGERLCDLTALIQDRDVKGLIVEGRQGC